MDELLPYAGIGLACGLRSMVGPAELSRHLSELPSNRPVPRASSLLADRSVRESLQLAAAGEMVVDKLPFVPDRIAPGPLIGRALSGALAAGVLAESRGESRLRCALVGAVSAVTGAFLGYHLRRAITGRAGVPDLPVALLEDAMAIALARRALRG